MQQQSKDYDFCSEKLISFTLEKQQHGDRATSSFSLVSDQWNQNCKISPTEHNDMYHTVKKKDTSSTQALKTV